MALMGSKFGTTDVYLQSIFWTDKLTNNDVLQRMHTERELHNTTKKLKITYRGRIFRTVKYNILMLIFEGKIEGDEWEKKGPELILTARYRVKFGRVVANTQ